MTREQCQHCGRRAYKDGRCYADNRTKGRPIADTVYCEWTMPPYALPGRILKPIKRKKTNGNKSNH